MRTSRLSSPCCSRFVRVSGLGPRPAEGRSPVQRRRSGAPSVAKASRSGRQPEPVQAPAAPGSRRRPAPGNPVVVIATSLGDITVELFKDQAPVSVENFLHYVNEGFYPGTIFHRVVRAS